MTQQPRRYTAEVEAAMRAAGMLPEPVVDGPPPGEMRYHIAVEQILYAGTARPSDIASVLRGLADQLDNKE